MREKFTSFGVGVTTTIGPLAAARITYDLWVESGRNPADCDRYKAAGLEAMKVVNSFGQVA